VEVPAAAVEPAARVNLLLPLPGAAMLVGVKVAVTPAGTPLMYSATAELNPDAAVVVNVMGVDAPGATVALVALDARVKLAGDKTVRANLRVLVVFPPTAPRVRL
jgi:predicted cation transporter